MVFHSLYIIYKITKNAPVGDKSRTKLQVSRVQSEYLLDLLETFGMAGNYSDWPCFLICV